MKISRIEIRRSGIQRLLQVSGALIILGLLVELASLMWFHPLSFVLFAFVSVPLIGLGVLVYLVSLVFVSTPPGGNSNSA
jgi:mannose/fructose/N-acetylgalactosamine-specific phosphotransferase system component IIC